MTVSVTDDGLSNHPKHRPKMTIAPVMTRSTTRRP
ncbi:Uncharacterised protein [Mycobacteroides abscessus subsp. abscessus]|nr:Uncharacterised protein [Mycobacteroides abscessus subsp. abscessus]